MRRKRFFKNIGTVLKFGFIGTVYCFFIYSGMMWGLNSLLGLGDGGLKLFECLSICSLLCSSDVIAAISMISFKDKPDMFSIVYGEGVANDIVSIIMFDTVQRIFGGGGEQKEVFSAATPFKIIG
jgi:NhaP-type Na+/H+ or K+/H+ antiporter